jgi:hypothetical protein
MHPPRAFIRRQRLRATGGGAQTTRPRMCMCLRMRTSVGIRMSAAFANPYYPTWLLK